MDHRKEPPGMAIVRACRPFLTSISARAERDADIAAANGGFRTNDRSDYDGGRNGHGG
jgi:hypothetical protein